MQIYNVMKKVYFSLTLLLFSSFVLFAQTDGGVSIGKGNVPAHDKAILELVSQSKGLLIPRMTTSQREIIFAGEDQSAKGLLVYDLDMSTIMSWTGSSWITINSSNINVLNGTTLPQTGTTGDIIYDAENNELYVYNGSVWESVGTKGIIPTGTNLPATGTAGDTFYNTTEKKFYIYNGTDWDVVSTDGGTPTSSVPLPVGTSGDTYYNTTEKIFYVSDGAEWIPVDTRGSTPTSSTAPPVGASGDTYYNTTEKVYYVSDGTKWNPVDTDSQTLSLQGTVLGIERGNNVDLSVLSGSIPSGISFPAGGLTGGLFYHTIVQKLYVYNGSNWYAVGGDGIIPTSSTVPPVGVSGYSYYNTTNSTYYISDGTNWVPMNSDSQDLSLTGNDLSIENGNSVDLSPVLGGTPSGPSVPAGGTAGDTFYNITEKKLYVYNGSDWDAVGSDGTTPTSSSAPPVGDAGDTYYNTTEKIYYVSDGTDWEPVGTDDQGLNLLGNTLSLEDGGTVDLSFYLDNTDDQTALEVNLSSGYTKPS
ncbi:MAG: hypothetical protein MI740_00310, partial [Halanaerobiales bacterium]|nr:hypothetical protein [Halanaerobiales bacterium]